VYAKLTAVIFGDTDLAAFSPKDSRIHLTQFAMTAWRFWSADAVAF
jgi:hypothetical protein